MSRNVAHLMLLVAAVLWGFGNVAQKTVLEHLDTLSAVGLRCLLATIVILPLMRISGERPRTLQWLPGALVVAVLFAVALVLQQAAYLSTTVTNASFLVNTATVMTPLVAWLVLGEATRPLVAVAAAMTLLGAFLMSGASISGLNTGDMLCLLSALVYACWMVALGWHVQRFGMPFHAALMQFALGAVLSLALAGMYEDIGFASVIAAAPELLILGVFSTALAFGLMTIAQRYTSASMAAVIVSGESVFGALGAFLFLGERMSLVSLFGATLILLAILLIALAPARHAVGPQLADGEGRRIA